jgi:hypothetical protein
MSKKQIPFEDIVLELSQLTDKFLTSRSMQKSESVNKP